MQPQVIRFSLTLTIYFTERDYFVIYVLCTIRPCFGDVAIGRSGRFCGLCLSKAYLSPKQSLMNPLEIYWKKTAVQNCSCGKKIQIFLAKFMITLLPSRLSPLYLSIIICRTCTLGIKNFLWKLVRIRTSGAHYFLRNEYW